MKSALENEHFFFKKKRTKLEEVATEDSNALKFVKYESGPIEARFEYKPGKRGAPSDFEWPPRGLHLELVFMAPKATVTVHYEMYDNVPFLTKWISVKSFKPLTVSMNAVEILSLNWPWAKQGNVKRTS